MVCRMSKKQRSAQWLVNARTTSYLVTVYQHPCWEFMNDVAPSAGQIQTIQQRSFILWHKTKLCQANGLHIPSTLLCDS